MFQNTSTNNFANKTTPVQLNGSINQGYKKKVNIFVAGTGTVGHELLHQIFHLNNSTYDLNVIGKCNTRFTKWKRKHSFSTNGISNSIEETEPTDWSKILNKIKNNDEVTVFADCTGCLKIAKYYNELLSSGIHVVTPGKIANSIEQEYFDLINSPFSKGKYYYEGTVGAGLPVLSTIKQLRETGDEIQSVEGVVSGTLTYIFEALENGIPFSTAVKKALELGYSEPDPRDDLSGEDVARKFLILARVSGHKIERKDFIVENQTPDELKTCSIEDFVAGLKLHDTYWETKVAQASKNKEVLRYVGIFKNNNISIGVKSYPESSPFGSLRGTDNQFIIRSKIYSNSPIVIQGPGAGKEVTAQIVLSDILKAAQSH